MSQPCANCKTLMGWPSEVLRGDVIGVCSVCGHVYGEPVVKTGPDPRGRPSIPGAAT